MRERAAAFNSCLRERLDTLLGPAMRKADIDMWLIICQEDNPDPILPTMVPMDAWYPILQILVFYDRGPDRGVERINLSRVDTKDLYERPWTGQRESEQWELLARLVAERDPKRIGINIGAVQWAAGGLTHNLYRQLTAALPPAYVPRLVSAEPACIKWLATLTRSELPLFRHVVEVAHAIIARCFSREAIRPGLTSAEDLRWYYWQQCADLGVEVSFLPYFTLRRCPGNERDPGQTDTIIRPGDCVHCDVGIRYLGLCSDHQRWAYVLRDGERQAPEGLRRLMAECNRLQDVYLDEFRHGLSGNELLARILTRARMQGIPGPRVYSHSLGHLLHEPGPLIGLPWEQESCPGRGDVTLDYDMGFTMELSVEAPLPEWGNAVFRLGMEEDVVFTADEGCVVLDGRQTEFYLV